MEKPRLELPRAAAPSRPVFDRRSTFFFLAGLLAFAALAWLTIRSGRSTHAGAPAVAAPLSAEQLEKLALRLEDKNLAQTAAETWIEYLDAAAPPADAAAKIHARIGRLLIDAGRYESAIAHLYRAEALSGRRDDAEIAMRLRECFQKMGRHAELAREIAERTSITKQPEELSGRQIIAEIGDEKITAADFDRMVRDEVEVMVRGMAEQNPSRAEQMRAALQQQMTRPDARERTLRQIVLRRVLSSEAREKRLDQSPEYRERLAAEAEMLLAQQVMSGVIAERATPTPQDVERYYETNGEQYVTPASGRIARIVCKTKDDADKVLELLREGAEFATLAKNRSTDAATRESGGLVEGELSPSRDAVPGIGDNAELRDKLWALDPGRHLAEPIETPDGWMVLQLHARTPSRTPSLDEIRDRVEADCAAARRDEVLRQYVDELFRKHRVRLHAQGLTPATQPTTRPGTQ